MLTIIIPFYNEESKNKKSLTQFLRELSKYILQSFNKNNKFILIDDGSKDRTVKELEKFFRKLKKNNKNKVIFIKNEKNRGHGYSIKRGFNLSKTKYVMSIPSDNDIPLIDYTKFISQNIDLVMLPWINIEKYSTSRLLLSRLFNLFYNMVFNVKVNYIQAPCVYKRKIFKKIKVFSNVGGTFLAELAIKFLKRNITFTEIFIYYNNKSVIDRTVSVSNFLKIIKDFIFLFSEVYIINRKNYKNKAKKIYF